MPATAVLPVASNGAVETLSFDLERRVIALDDDRDRRGASGRSARSGVPQTIRSCPTLPGRQGGAMLGSEADDSTMFDRIVGWVEDGGYLAIALLMLLENLFRPFPPS